MKTANHQNTTRYYLCTAIMWIIMAGTTAFGQTLYSQTVVSDAPLAYWNFDEATGNAIQQIGPFNAANNLVPAFDATRVAHGSIGSGLLLGNAADLDGTSDNFNATALTLGPASLATPWAIEFWMQLQPPQSGEYIISLHPGGAQSIVYDFQPDRMYFEPGTGGITSLSAGNTSWHHLVWLRNVAGKFDVYLDGVFNANAATPGNPVLPLNYITVGDYTAGGGLGFLGRLDEVAIYDFSAFTDDASLKSHVDDLVVRHLAASVVPEPSSFALVGVGGLIMLLIQRRKVHSSTGTTNRS
jgi:hypothetical protein